MVSFLAGVLRRNSVPFLQILLKERWEIAGKIVSLHLQASEGVLETMEYRDIVNNFLAVATLHRTLRRGEMVSDLADIGNTVYYVKSGSVKIAYLVGGREHILEFGLEGGFVTNLLSFLTGKRTDIYLQAMRRTELIGVPRPYLSRLISEKPALLEGYVRILEHVVADRLQKEMILNMPSPADRIQALAELYPNVFQLVPQKYIAAYLGIAPETFSRQLSQ